MSNSKISQALQALFEKHRIVFWYDAKDEFKADFEQLQLHGVEKIQLNNNEFGVKHRLLRLEPDHKFLLYAAYPQPDDLENWLLDIQLAQGEFRTDQVALWLAELELGLGFADVIKAHSEFFQASKRKDSLKRLLVADDTPHLVRLKMLSICSSADSGLDTILESLLAELADDRDDKIRLIQRCSLDGFLWQQLQRHYSYESTNPSIKDFSLELFKSCYALATAQTAKLSHHALVFLKRWKDSVKHRQYFEKLSENCAKDLGLKQLLETHDFRQLMDMDYVEEIDRKILRELVQGVTQRTLLHNEVSQWVRQRRSSYWYDRFAHVYNAIDAASAFIFSLNSTKLDISSLADGIQRYSQEWFKLDQYYRKFIYHLRESKQPSLLNALNTLIENLYSNNYLLTLNDRWQVFVDNASTWDSTSFPSQRQFFNRSVKPFLERNAKVCVIISDALRYEVGEELLSLVRQEDRYDANLEPMVSMLPSYTQLGMAALLPHQQLAIADNQTGETLVDGQSSKGSDNRKKILNKRLSASDVILAKNFMVLNRDDSRAIVRDNDVLYIYHNLIDKTGDSLGTEERTFDAAEQTLVEMISLIKKLTNANVNNILLTADHGFIYQDQTLAESDFLSSDPQASTVLYRNRRFLLGKDFQPHPSFKHFHSSQLGLVGDVEVMLPKSINRLRLQGSGSRFVHGAASLQEVIIPLLHINKKRQSDLSQVDIEVLRGSANKITTNHLSVMLYQLQPVTDKCRPRTLRIGLYSEAGVLISDSHDVIFDRHSDNAREREIPIRLILTSQDNKLNGQTVSLRLDEQIDGTSHYKPYTALNYLMQRSFASDFDF